MELSKDFEDKIDTQWLPEQVKELEEEDERIRKAMN